MHFQEVNALASYILVCISKRPVESLGANSNWLHKNKFCEVLRLLVDNTMLAIQTMKTKKKNVMA